MLLSVVLTAVLLPTVLLSRVSTMLLPWVSAVLRVLRWGRHAADLAAGEVDVDAALVLLRLVVQAKIAADLLDSRFNLLDMIAAVVSLAHNDVQVVFAPALGSFDALFQYVLSFLDKQAVQIDCVICYSAVCVVFTENIVARLTVILFHLRSVLLPLLRQVVSACAVAGLVSLVGSIEAGTTFRCFLTSKVAETVIFGFGIAVGVVERWGTLERSENHRAIE